MIVLSILLILFSEKINSQEPESNRKENDNLIFDSEPSAAQDWLTTDKIIHSGYLNGNGFRRMDCKRAEDNNLYAALISYDVRSKGSIKIYRSVNNGIWWSNIASASNDDRYFGQLSILVERRLSNNDDSVRIFVFYNSSTSPNMDNARINFFSVRRNGYNMAPIVGGVSSPNPGKKLTYPSAVSDGFHYDMSTSIGVAFTEQANNETSSTINFSKSLNWGSSWMTSTINTLNNDVYPSAAFKRYLTSDGAIKDSLWISVERRLINSTTKVIKIISTSWTPSTLFYTYNFDPNIILISKSCEKPSLTIKQDSPVDSAMLTFTSNGVAVYNYTTNGGSKWITYAPLGMGSNYNGNNKQYTWALSYPGGSGGNFMGIWVSNDGDSINVRRGGLGNMGATTYKINSFNSSPIIIPVSCICEATGNLYSLVAYAGKNSDDGFPPLNIYYDSESLSGTSPSGSPTDINNLTMKL
ncbi:MAG: hypothetical protein M3R36_19410 [Bacteroidota bacterium]|nr:hypothetical protein [Bacteroidota bacterium]